MFPENGLFMSKTNAETVKKIRMDTVRPILKILFFKK